MFFKSKFTFFFKWTKKKKNGKIFFLFYVKWNIGIVFVQYIYACILYSRHSNYIREYYKYSIYGFLGHLLGSFSVNLVDFRKHYFWVFRINIYYFCVLVGVGGYTLIISDFILYFFFVSWFFWCVSLWLTILI